MTLQEAYQFLDLPENASRDILAARYREKDQFFRMLHDNAPNPIIRKLQEKNLQALADIRSLLPAIAPSGPLPAPQRPQPVAAGPAMPGSRPAPPRQAPATNHEALAWLVMHTEGRRTESFPLYEGDNPVGRLAVEAKPSVLIGGDTYVSRNHCTLILAYARGELAAAIADDGRYNHGNPSLNGTYYNGQEARLSMQRLREGDTVQIGMTKLVFKWNQASRQDIEEEVLKSDFIRTIVVDI